MQQKKSKAMAATSFVFSLFFWVPLLNLIFGATSVYLGIKSLAKIKKEPNLYGGRWLAIIGIILSVIVYLTYLMGVGMCVFGYSQICTSIGLEFLA